MYTFKTEMFKEIKEKYKINNIAREVRLTNGYLSLIFNGKVTCPYTTAFTIVKALDDNAEIETYFTENK